MLGDIYIPGVMQLEIGGDGSLTSLSTGVSIFQMTSPTLNWADAIMWFSFAVQS